MKHLARATLTLSVLAFLAAIWQPYGPWWAWLLTGDLLLLVGAALGGQTTQQHPTGNSTGPHIHIPGPGYTADEVTERIDHHKARQAALHPDRPTYGKPKDGDDQ